MIAMVRQLHRTATVTIQTGAAKTHSRAAHAQFGAALALAVHVLLLAAVLGQIVFLASRHRVRVDLTSDQMYSLTESTRTLLGRLDKQLLVEAYFSPKEKLPVTLRDTRVVLDNFLDELVQLGKGRVAVQRFDPNSDKAIADKCQRIGVQPADLRGGTATSVSFDRHWQGLRLVYGGSKQKVIPQIGPQSSFQAEAAITPAIKEVLSAQKHKFGYMEWPATAIGQQQPGGIGWNVVRSAEDVAKRYEFQNVKDEDGALLADDLTTLLLFRPKDLTDRQKYVIDQFVLKGGTVVVFADAAEYAIGPNRMFTKMPLQLDAAGSQKRFQDQLLSYGIDWRQKVLADMSPEAFSPRDRIQGAQEYLAVPQQTMFGRSYAVAAYPYFFHAVAGDWSKIAEQVAQLKQGGQPNAAVAEQLKRQLQPGLPSDEFLFKTFKQFGRGPGFYWPTWVGLRQKLDQPDLPEGATGKVLLWSSPLVLAEEPPQNLDPIGRDMARINETFGKFVGKLEERKKSEPAQQAPLMVDVRGTFASFFAGGERPKRPSEIKEAEAKKAADDAAADGKAAKDGEKPADGADPLAAKPKDLIGPEAPKSPEEMDAEASKPAPEPEPLLRSAKPGRLVVIGDADFLRDDLVQGTYAEAGGPVSIFGRVFWAQLLDWLAEDKDLVALQSRVPVDRALKFVDTAVGTSADPRVAEQALANTTRWLRGLNIVLPGLLLTAFGLCVFFVRRAQKRAFLASLS